MVSQSSGKPKYDIRNLAVTMMSTTSLCPFARNPRDHGNAHVGDIARSIEAFGMIVPILCDDLHEIIAGHATVLACKKLGIAEVPVIVLGHLSEVEKVAFRIAHNRLCEKGKWDLELLASNFELIYAQDLSFDLEITGFDTGEIDVARLGGTDKIKAEAKSAVASAEVVEMPDPASVPVSRIGDRFTIDRHVIVCGNSCEAEVLKFALGPERADLGLSDPPYGCAIAGHASGLGKITHADFIMGSNMSPEEHFEFMTRSFRSQAAFSKPGAFNIQFTDWRAMLSMLRAGAAIYQELKHICVWKKTNGGMGSLWRNSWEGILVFRVAGGKTRNNVMLGKHGRNRNDVFECAGVNTFRAGRMEELQGHPTCKPIRILADLILDVTPVRGLVLDVFLGSGSTILAAHETERRGVGIELDPKYVDVAIRRIEKQLSKPAIHESGMTFGELAEARALEHGDGR